MDSEQWVVSLTEPNHEELSKCGGEVVGREEEATHKLEKKPNLISEIQTST